LLTWSIDEGGNGSQPEINLFEHISPPPEEEKPPKGWGRKFARGNPYKEWGVLRVTVKTRGVTSSMGVTEKNFYVWRTAKGEVARGQKVQ